eukprot:Platyproteum_vivax@DN5098_c0_g1_i4.p1
MMEYNYACINVRGSKRWKLTLDYFIECREPHYTSLPNLCLPTDYNSKQILTNRISQSVSVLITCLVGVTMKRAPFPSFPAHTVNSYVKSSFAENSLSCCTSLYL